MYKHLLIAIDGSDLSNKALNQGLELAKALSADTTILHVTQPWSSVAVGEIAVMFPPQDYETQTTLAAESLLDKAKAKAASAGVPARTVHASDAQPYRAILDVAEKEGADLIVMGSHGRRGIAGFLLGSQTQKTLTHGRTPVLVYRE